MSECVLQCGTVARLREGRVFLAGDAAHTFSLTTGQGMNCGMQDAYNLAWKLALCHKQLGKPLLLDSYAEERLPVARALLDVAGTPDLVATAHPQAENSAGLHDSLLGFLTAIGLLQRRAEHNLSALEVGYRQSPIVAQDQATHVSTEREEGAANRRRDWLDFGHDPVRASALSMRRS